MTHFGRRKTLATMSREERDTWHRWAGRAMRRPSIPEGAPHASGFVGMLITVAMVAALVGGLASIVMPYVQGQFEIIADALSHVHSFNQ